MYLINDVILYILSILMGYCHIRDISHCKIADIVRSVKGARSFSKRILKCFQHPGAKSG